MGLFIEQYRIGWEKNGKWKYILVYTEEDMLAEVADKMCMSDKVSVRRIKKVNIPKEEHE